MARTTVRKDDVHRYDPQVRSLDWLRS